MKKRNEPEGLIWHDEQPQAVYPSTCAKCGRYAHTTYCNTCCDELLRKESTARQAELSRYYHGGAR